MKPLSRLSAIAARADRARHTTCECSHAERDHDGNPDEACCYGAGCDCQRFLLGSVVSREDVPWLLKRLAAAERVIEAVRTWDKAVEEGFASEVRPDIARAMVIRALAAYDAEDGE